MSDDENVVARRIDLYTMLLDAGAEVSICELANAAMYCGAEVVEVLLEHGVVPTSRTLSNILENYVDHDILRVILAASPDDIDIDADIIYHAFSFKDDEIREQIFNIFLESEKIELDVLLDLVTRDGHGEMAQRCVAPRVASIERFRTEIENGNVEAIMELLEDENIIPAPEILVLAVQQGNAEIVRLLLENGQFNPTSYNNNALGAAIGVGSIDIIGLLLQDGRVDPFARDNLLINAAELLLTTTSNAARRFPLELTVELLRDSRVTIDMFSEGMRAEIEKAPEGVANTASDVVNAGLSAALENDENTMNTILHHTARFSESALRERFSFPIVTANGAQEENLITDLIKEFEDKRQELIASGEIESVTIPQSDGSVHIQCTPHYHDLNVAINALRGQSHTGGDYENFYANNNALSFVHEDIAGYGMKNIAALYYKAIRDGGGFQEGVTREDGIDSMIRSIADSVRGNNRNNEDGIDDEEAVSHPICGQGHYNKIASEFSTILQDVNLIQDAQSSMLDNMREALANELVKYISVNDDANYDAENIVRYWNEGAGDKPDGHDEFLREFIEIYQDVFSSFINREFAAYPEIIEELSRCLPILVGQCGGPGSFIETLDIPLDSVRQAIKENLAASQIQSAYKSSKEKVAASKIQSAYKEYRAAKENTLALRTCEMPVEEEFLGTDPIPDVDVKSRQDEKLFRGGGGAAEDGQFELPVGKNKDEGMLRKSSDGDPNAKAESKIDNSLHTVNRDTGATEPERGAAAEEPRRDAAVETGPGTDRSSQLR